MILRTMVELPMYKQLHVPVILSLTEWEKRFLLRSTRAKKVKYKNAFFKFYKLIQLSKECNARHVDVKSFNNSMQFIFDFNDEESLDKFTECLMHDNQYQIESFL